MIDLETLMRRRFILFLILPLFIAITCCKERPGKKTPSGVEYWDLREGDGETAVPGKQVRVHYTGWLENGKRFDTSLISGHPFHFVLGAGQVIKGWEEGIAGMKVGGKRKLRIPPQLGYGARGFPPNIPPNSTLIFEVELVDVRSLPQS